MRWGAARVPAPDLFSRCVDGRRPAANRRPPSQAPPFGALWWLPRAGPPRAVCVRAIHRRRRVARLRTPLARLIYPALTVSPAFATTALLRMTRGKGASVSLRRRTQRKRHGTWFPPSPPSPCEDVFEHPHIPPSPPPTPSSPMPPAAPGGHRPPPGFGRGAEGWLPRPLKGPHSPLGRGRRHGERDDCEQQRRNVLYRGDWDGRAAGGGSSGPVRAGLRESGDKDGWRPPSPPRPPLGAPPRPTRGPKFSANYFGGSARRPPAGGSPGPPSLLPHQSFCGRVYRSCSPLHLPRPPPPGPPRSPQSGPPHFRGSTSTLPFAFLTRR